MSEDTGFSVLKFVEKNSRAQSSVYSLASISLISYNFSLTLSIGKIACKIETPTPNIGKRILNGPPSNNANNKLEKENIGKKISINPIISLINLCPMAYLILFYLNIENF